MKKEEYIKMIEKNGLSEGLKGLLIIAYEVGYNQGRNDAVVKFMNEGNKH